jgi:hypothetical protein
MRMLVCKTKLQLILYASDGPFATVNAYIVHIICLPATVDFRNVRHWGFFFQGSDSAVFVICICCIVNITELLLKTD